MRVALVCAFAGVAALGSSQLLNASFEAPVFTDGGYGGPLTGWSGSLDSDFGAWNIFSGYGFFNSEAPHGTQVLYSNATSVAQQSSEVVGVGENKITAMAGRRADSYYASFELQMWAGGTVSNGAVTGGTLLATSIFDRDSIAPSSFTPIEAVYTAAEGDPILGQLITVRFFKTLGPQMSADDVQVNGAVPEPASIVAISAAAVAFFRRRRSA